MTNQHPITPPPELVSQWLCSEDFPWEHPLEHRFITITNSRLQNVATQAAQWGADQEMEACCQWLFENDYDVAPVCLRTARRPKLPTLKEQALEALDRMQDQWPNLNNKAVIRRALEALDD